MCCRNIWPTSICLICCIHQSLGKEIHFSFHGSSAAYHKGKEETPVISTIDIELKKFIIDNSNIYKGNHLSS